MIKVTDLASLFGLSKKYMHQLIGDLPCTKVLEKCGRMTAFVKYVDKDTAVKAIKHKLANKKYWNNRGKPKSNKKKPVDIVPEGYLTVRDCAKMYNKSKAVIHKYFKEVETTSFYIDIGRTRQMTRHIKADLAHKLITDKMARAKIQKQKKIYKQFEPVKIIPKVEKPVLSFNQSVILNYIITNDYTRDQHICRMAQRNISVAKIALCFGMKILHVTKIIHAKTVSI